MTVEEVTKHAQSLPTRGAWIEIDVIEEINADCYVAPYAGSVD